MLPIGILAGAAIGAATTYVYKDESARQWLSDTAGQAADSVKSGAQSVMSMFNTTEEAVETVAEGAADVEESVAEGIDTVQEAVAESAETIQEEVAEAADTPAEDKFDKA